MNSKEETIKKLAFYEGLTIEEAVLTTKARKALPSAAFCGPERSYPAHDKKHVRNALSRLSQFGHRLKPAVRARILACLKRRAKRFGIETEETVQETINHMEMPEEERKEIVEWFLNKEFKIKGD